MDDHITILAALYIAFSALGIIAAIIVFTVIAGGGMLSGDPEAIAITATVASAVSFLIFILSVPGLIGGIGLLKRRQWARILVIILGFLNLINIPIGTVLGIYTLWVLMKDGAAAAFSREEQEKVAGGQAGIVP